MENQCSVAIVGAGIAGAATAYFLTQLGVRDIVLLERDLTAGTHSTGRNAAILRTHISDPVLRRIARDSGGFYFRPPAAFSLHPLLNPVGIFLAAREEHAWDLQNHVDEIEEDHAWISADPTQLYVRIPWLARGLTAVLHQPDEGVLDVHAILQSFLQGACQAGARLWTSCEARRLRVRGARIEGLDTSAGFLSADRVVLAGGAWASDLATAAGYPLPLVPFRRHLLVTEPLPEVDRAWPVVWILSEEFYFRPESRGLLLCACDTVPVAPEQGEVTDPTQAEHIAAKTTRWLPGLSGLHMARIWAGMRTFAPDHRFVVGPDPRLPGLYWAAGLAGHGITCAPLVGRLAAQWIAKGTCEHPAASALLPDRLLP